MRLQNETFAEYKDRLKKERNKLKEKLRGKFLAPPEGERHFTRSERERKRQQKLGGWSRKQKNNKQKRSG